MPEVGADSAYCREALDALRRLEENRYRRNEAKRAFDKKVDRRRSAFSTVVALLLPLLVWVYILTARFDTIRPSHLGADTFALVTRTFGLLAVNVFMFLIVFAACTYLWDTTVFSPLSALVERSLRPAYLSERAAVDATAREILSEKYFTEGRIPERYLSTQMISLLLRFFDSGQSTFLESAVYMLDRELANSAYYQNLVPKQTLVTVERAQIDADEREADL